MNIKYLIIDASLNGTGIRDAINGGYIVPETLNLSTNVILSIKQWLLAYENEHYNGYENELLTNELDKKGKELARAIKSELIDSKIEYFSDARMIKEPI